MPEATATINVAVTDNDGTTWRGTSTVTLAADPPEAPPAPNPMPPMVGVHDYRGAAAPLGALAYAEIPSVLYVPGSLIDRVAAASQPAWEREQTVVVALSPDPAQVTAGQWDPYLRELGEWISDEPGEILLAPWPNPEADMGGAAYARYFNHIVGQINGPGHGALMVYVADAAQWAPGEPLRRSVRGRTDRPEEWTRVAADFFAVNVESGLMAPLEATLPEHPGFVRWRSAVAGVDTAWMVTRRVFYTGTDHTTRADAIRREADWLATDAARGCRGYLYWNWPGGMDDDDAGAAVLDPVHGERALSYLAERLTGGGE